MFEIFSPFNSYRVETPNAPTNASNPKEINPYRVSKTTLQSKTLHLLKQIDGTGAASDEYYKYIKGSVELYGVLPKDIFEDQIFLVDYIYILKKALRILVNINKTSVNGFNHKKENEFIINEIRKKLDNILNGLNFDSGYNETEKSMFISAVQKVRYIE